MPDAASKKLIRRILAEHPNTQTAYLYGSWGTEDQWPSSDIDIAILLPPGEAKAVDGMAWLDLAVELSRIAGTEKADLANLRKVNALLRKEVVAADEFEMLSIWFYQKMNEERREIVEEFHRTGRTYNV